MSGYRRMEVTRKNENLFYVTSQSDPSVHYNVRQSTSNVWYCNCPHFSHRDVQTCKHTDAVIVALRTGNYKDLTSKTRSELTDIQGQLAHLQEQLRVTLARLG